MPGLEDTGGPDRRRSDHLGEKPWLESRQASRLLEDRCDDVRALPAARELGEVGAEGDRRRILGEAAFAGLELGVHGLAVPATGAHGKAAPTGGGDISVDSARTTELRVAARRYQALPFALRHAEWWLIWCGDDDGADGVVLDERRRIVTARDLGELRAWKSSRGLQIEDEEGAFHDLTIIERWLAAPDDEVDCIAFLAAWNLFADVARTTTGKPKVFEADLGDVVQRCYEKIFFGNNLPAMTPPGEHYEPAWSEEEVTVLRSVMGAGLQLFRSYL
ncbi:MAG: hypothetical protein ACAI25_15455 [Planctomycetota bacterium]